MNEKDLNNMARLMEGASTPQERERILEEVSKDPDSARLLAGLHLPDSEGAEEPASFPFPIGGFCRFGTAAGFFRWFESEELEVTPALGRIADGIRRIAGDRIPVCFRGGLEVNTGENRCGLIRFEKREGRQGVSLFVDLDKELPRRGDFEVWLDGEKVQTSSAASIAERPLFGIDPGGTWAIRHTGRLMGISIRLRPIQFQAKDWLGASLACALEGEFSEAATLVRERVGDKGPLRKASDFLESLRGMVSMDAGRLVPLPATRSAQGPGESRGDTFRSVWRGVLSIHPAAVSFPSPWESDSSPPPSSETSLLPREALALIEAIQAAVAGKEIPNRPPPGSVKPTIEAGWAALAGWSLALEGNHREALREFRNAPEVESDPFNIQPAMSLASHLLETGSAGNAEEPRSETIETNDAIWRDVFEEAWDLSENAEEGAPS